MILGDLGELIAECEKNMGEEYARDTAPFSWADAEADFYCRLRKAVIIDAKPVVHGCWYFVNCSTGRCSNCGHIVKTDLAFHPNYCEECGCKMDRIPEKKEETHENDNC